MKLVFTDELVEGMITGKDSYTSSGIIILPKGIKITNAIIKHLESLGVEAVYIDENGVVDVEDSFEQEEFRQFSVKYVDTKDKLNNTFGKILNNNIDKDEIKEMIDASWKMLDAHKNSYNMMNMLYSMHSYSDTTYMHSMNVGMIASLIGRWAGWSEDDIRIVNACGMFHDIGKMTIPKEILDKPGKLTDEEYAVIKQHTLRGYNLIKNYDMDSRIKNAALLHHERCNGSGYPFGLQADKLDRFTRVIAIADVYEALTANIVYRGPVCPFDVVAQFEETGFGIFDTEYLLIFLRNILESYIHSKVKLSNGENAEVILINKTSGARPVVLTTSGRAVDLSKERGIKIESVLE